MSAKLDALVMRALERDQSARWPNAGEFLAALNKYLYSLDETPGPRELAALVARFCPPETRRLPTHVPSRSRAGSAAWPVDEGHAEGQAAEAASDVRDPRRARGLARRPDDEGGAARAGAPAAPDPPAAESESGPGSEAEAASSSAPRRPRRPERIDDTNPSRVVPTSKPERPGRGFMVVLGVGAVVLSIAAVYTFFAKRDDVLHTNQDAAIPGRRGDRDRDRDPRREHARDRRRRACSRRSIGIHAAPSRDASSIIHVAHSMAGAADAPTDRAPAPRPCDSARARGARCTSTASTSVVRRTTSWSAPATTTCASCFPPCRRTRRRRSPSTSPPARPNRSWPTSSTDHSETIKLAPKSTNDLHRRIDQRPVVQRRCRSRSAA